MITVATTIHASLQKVWDCFTLPEHITEWYHASDDWHAPYAENNLQVGGTFKTTMAAKDGSFSFDLEGTYTNIEQLKSIDFNLADNRKVSVTFSTNANNVTVTEVFEPESVNSLELQQMGWQAILDNFKKHVEAHKS